MSEANEYTIDKSEWPDGPWKDEPDKVVWIDEATDLDCMIVRGPTGAWCGYVGVPPEHPYYDHPDQYSIPVEVHGGVTYGGRCQEGGDVCHVPQAGREPDVYWIGFDCAHSGDRTPAFERALGAAWVKSLREWETYKNQAYVTAEVTRLAIQLEKVEA